LAALTFLDGCWSHRGVDWGYSLCFHREGFEWVGAYESNGPMGPTEKIGLLITRDERGTVFTAGKRFSEGRHTDAGAGRVVFGTGDTKIEFKRDAVTGWLVFKRGAVMEQLRPGR
jgi:hypothetical protein